MNAFARTPPALFTFAHRLESFGERPALILEDGGAVSYRALAARADAAFAELAAPARTLVAIECQISADTLVGYLGALRNDYPALLVDAGLDADLRERLYDHFGVAWCWRADGTWRARHAGSPAVHPDVALLMSTSGSTGAPKLVRLSLRNLQANARSIAQFLQIGDAERPITTLPLHYSYGLSVVNSHLHAGATILLCSQPVTARGFWDFFREHDASSLAGVPTIYDMLRKLRFERMTLPSLWTMTQAGGRLAPDTVRWFDELAKARGQRFVVMYGQTEATARMAYVPPHALPDKAGSIGVAIPEGRLELIDDDGSPIEQAGLTGELRYSGPNVMLGYAEDRAGLARPDMLGGTLDTGDLAWRDEQGYFHIVGRRKRFIKVFGNRIGLDEVESQLRDRQYDVAVTGRDDLLVVAMRGEAGTAEQMAADLSGRYRLHRSAIRVVQVDAFPVSAAGKIQYAELLGALAP